MNRRLPFVLSAAAALGTIAIPSAVGASVSSNSQSPMYHGTPTANNGGTHTRDACYAGPADTLPVSGNVVAHRDPNGSLTINVVIRNGQPDSTYAVSTGCYAFLGTIETNRAGTGAGHFVIATTSAANPGSATFQVNVYDSAAKDRFVSGVLTAS